MSDGLGRVQIGVQVLNGWLATYTSIDMVLFIRQWVALNPNPNPNHNGQDDNRGSQSRGGSARLGCSCMPGHTPELIVLSPKTINPNPNRKQNDSSLR